MSEAYRGIALMLAAMTVFASQDGISRLLAEDIPPLFIVMIRYWAFAAFVLALSSSRPGGVRAQAQTARLVPQIIRGLMLVAQIVLITYSFVALGLAETHALMAVYPLLIAAMSALFLGERVDKLQWAAIGAGFLGVLILLQPTGGVFDVRALVPLFCAVLFAAYGVLTRWVGQVDRPSVSFFYTGIAGAVGSSLIGPFFWSEMTSTQWAWMALLCVTGAGGHFLLIKAYEVSEAARLQPFAYWQLVLASLIGVFIFGEILDLPLLIGTGIVVAAGLFTLWRAQARAG
jgi:drug/metabolite transporter (DMT)-like permease